MLKQTTFTPTWKKGKLRLFQKNGKLLNSANSLRPITLIPILGKLFEKLLAARTEEQLANQNHFGDHQHGFTAQRSTTTAIRALKEKMQDARKMSYAAVVAVDFTLAFDTLSWPHIKSNLESKQIDRATICPVKELLLNRSVTYEDGCRRIERQVQVGCPQGSASSPLIWRIGMEDLLEGQAKNGAEPYAYADDDAMVIVERNKQRFKKLIRTRFKVIGNRSKRLKVKLNLAKTAVMWIGKKTWDEDLRIGRTVL